MENIRKRRDIQLVSSKSMAKKLTKKLNYNSQTIFSEALVAVHMGKIKVFFNKLVYLETSILEISKTVMYDFHYNYIKHESKFGDKAKLLYTDTDGLLYEIETEDFYKVRANDVHEWFDTSGCGIYDVIVHCMTEGYYGGRGTHGVCCGESDVLCDLLV